jgi:hypothetical protein
MLTITKEITLYRFDELNDDAQEKVVNTLFTGNDFSYQAESTIDYYKDEVFPQHGITATNVWYSGFYSQGDGLCIDGEIDLVKFIKSRKLGNQFRRVLYYISVGELSGSRSIKGIERDYYSRLDDRREYADTKTDRQYDLLQDELAHLFELAQDAINDVTSELYFDLRKYYEYITSLEYAREECAALDYHFTEDGTLYHID